MTIYLFQESRGPLKAKPALEGSTYKVNQIRAMSEQNQIIIIYKIINLS